jgi:hypothetical protein
MARNCEQTIKYQAKPESAKDLDYAGIYSRPAASGFCQDCLADEALDHCSGTVEYDLLILALAFHAYELASVLHKDTSGFFLYRLPQLMILLNSFP